MRRTVFVFDLDGCVWVGDEPTPGAVEAVNALRAAGQLIVREAGSEAQARSCAATPSPASSTDAISIRPSSSCSPVTRWPAGSIATNAP